VKAAVRRARRERRAITALAAVAALRVLLLSAAFPFFDQVDEHQHMDTVHRWSRGELPGRDPVHLRDPVVDWALRFGTFEYLEPNPPPPYLARRGAGPESPWLPRVRAAYQGVLNQEAESPPVYYAVAALWYRLGETWLGDLDLLLWVRALNALALGALVWWSHVWLRRWAPGDRLLHWGAPALLAFFPQDAFYGIGPDGFSALVGGLAFAAAVEAARPLPRPGRSDGLAGVAVALAFLTKYTSLVYAGLLGLALALRHRTAGESPRRVLLRLAWAGGASATLAGGWLLRNQLVVGDALGTARKIAHLEWTPLPLSALLSQPIFRPSGLLEWAPETLALFWRGEFRWLGEPMTLAGLDPALAGVSLLLLACGSVSAWRAARRGTWLEPLAWLATMGGFASLAVLSARFEFADWGNPTRAHPYFTEGRLVLGVLLPFVVVFVRGLAVACARLPSAAPVALLGAWIAYVSLTDWLLAAAAFASPWNWIHSP